MTALGAGAPMTSNGVSLTQTEEWKSMTRLNDTAFKAELRKSRAAQEEIVDGAVPGLAVRIGRGPTATWSLVLRVRGEGGVSRRGIDAPGDLNRQLVTS